MISRTAVTLAVIMAFASVAPVSAGHGHGNGNGGLPPGQAKKLAGGVVPGVCVPGNGHGKGACGVSNVMPPVAPNICKAAKGGNLRSTGQHVVNAFHPTGQTRATAEHVLNDANKLLKVNGHGQGHGHGHGKWKW